MIGISCSFPYRTFIFGASFSGNNKKKSFFNWLIWLSKFSKSPPPYSTQGCTLLGNSPKTPRSCMKHKPTHIGSGHKHLENKFSRFFFIIVIQISTGLVNKQWLANPNTKNFLHSWIPIVATWYIIFRTTQTSKNVPSFL